MSDYDTEFHKCLDKGKSIKNKLNKRSENLNNNSNNPLNSQIDNMINDSLEEFSKMIKNIKYLTNNANISNQEKNRRNDNNKKLEEMLMQYQKQMEINQVNLKVLFLFKNKIFFIIQFYFVKFFNK